MPAAVLGPVLAAGVTGVAGIVGGKMQSSANTKAAETASEAANRAAQIQADAARYASDAQAKAAADALAYQKEQARLDAARAEAAQRGNYDQWAAQQRRLSTLGELLGLGARQLPAYTPGPVMAPPDPGAPKKPQSDPSLRAILATQQQAGASPQMPPVPTPQVAPLVRPFTLRNVMRA